MAVLALLYVGLGLEEERSNPVISLPTIEVILNVITAIFVTEFVVRIYGAPSRWRYLKRHWIDILAVLPSLRYLRVLGLARLPIEIPQGHPCRRILGVGLDLPARFINGPLELWGNDSGGAGVSGCGGGGEISAFALN